jgi:hypothetical protein
MDGDYQQYNQQQASSGRAYANYILTKWMEIMEVAEDFRYALLSRRVDHDIAFDYISRLTRMWGELRPKVEGRTDGEFKDFEATFMKFEPYFYDPSKLLQVDETGASLTTKDDIFQLETTLRETIEKLKLTAYE